MTWAILQTCTTCHPAFGFFWSCASSQGQQLRVTHKYRLQGGCSGVLDSPGLTWRCLQPHHYLVCSPFQERAEVTLRMSLGKVSLVGCSWSAAQLRVIPRDSNCIILEAGHVQPCLIFWSVFFKWDFLCNTLYNVRVVMCWAFFFLGTFLALWNGLIANSATWRPALSHFHHSVL